MDENTVLQPLPHKRRQRTFIFLVCIFLISIPLLYFYATGYRFDVSRPTNFVSTGGISITIGETDAEIFIDDAPVEANRTFRRALYIQGIDVGTHRIHIQKEGYHTWVKELPVSERIVTETAAFNTPLVPQVRVITPWLSSTGTAVLRTPIQFASTTNEVIVATTTSTSTYSKNTEFEALKNFFIEATTTATSTKRDTIVTKTKDLLTPSSTTTTATSTQTLATSTTERSGVKLHHVGEDVYATWVGTFERMPYYYCAGDFPRYSTTTELSDKVIEAVIPPQEEPEEVLEEPESTLVIHPVQTVPVDTECIPTIRIDRKWEQVHDFEFYPGTTDLVLILRDSGLYAVEIDDRSWQNVQQVFPGSNLKMHISNEIIFVYDGINIYALDLLIE